jgi:triosephosphate isomerase
MRKKIIAGNWKMNHGPKATVEFIDEFLRICELKPMAEWVLFPPFTSLPALAQKLNIQGSHPFVRYGAQNCHFEKSGAFTGEISPLMLSELGCAYTLVGHSERRQLFNETNLLCSKKIQGLTHAGVTPLLCVGETQAERDSNLTSQVLKTQIFESLRDWVKDSPLVIAYEPVWAIGTGKVATPIQADEAHQMVRGFISEIAGQKRAAEMQILYGGSVKPENARELSMFPNIDGFLVGGASLSPKTFAQIGQMPL